MGEKETVIYTVKEMADAIGHSQKYVMDMKKGGFRLPATKSQAEEFIRLHGPPRRFRSIPTRMSLYSHDRPSCQKNS